MMTQLNAEVTRMRIEELHRQAASYRLTRRTDLQQREGGKRRTSRFARRRVDRRAATA